MIKPTDLQAYFDYMVEWRRDLHMFPEPGFKEFRTSKKLEEELGVKFGESTDHSFGSVISSR